MSEKNKINNIASSYYARKDVQKVIIEFSQDREVIPRYYNADTFGKRPDTLQYPSDLIEQVKKGATSFHCSEELWNNPLQLKTDMTIQEQNDLRKGWDLLIDIDSKYLDYSKITCILLIEALEFHNITSYKVKFSGSKGFHIIVPWKAFPKEFSGEETKDMFPDWARHITRYLNEFIKQQLIERVANLGEGKMSKYIKGDKEVGDATKKVTPDLILVSSRHLFRAPYSLHEKTRLASIVLEKNEIKNFEPKNADPLRVEVKNFYPAPKEGEARELLIQALDWVKSQENAEEREKNERRKNKPKREYKDYKDIQIKNITPDLYPPCVKKILKGLKDGRKRALFILLNFFRSIGLEQDEIEEKIEKWNKKNPKPLKKGYIQSQLKWTFRQKKMMPYNCNREHYRDIGVCEPDDICKLIKNPVNYTIKKAFKSGKVKTTGKKKNGQSNTKS